MALAWCLMALSRKMYKMFLRKKVHTCKMALCIFMQNCGEAILWECTFIRGTFCRCEKGKAPPRLRFQIVASCACCVLHVPSHRLKVCFRKSTCSLTWGFTNSGLHFQLTRRQKFYRGTLMARYWCHTHFLWHTEMHMVCVLIWSLQL